MTSTGRDWDEVHLSEDPAIELLRHLGYTYLPPEDAERERHSLRDVVLVGRLEAALRKLNPWLAVEQVPQAVRGLTTIQAGSLIEANEHAHRAIVGGPTAQVETDGARQSKTIRYIDFDHPERNDLVVTRQFVVKGMKKHIIPDIVLFVNGIPLAVIECKSPTIGERWREDGVQNSCGTRRRPRAIGAWAPRTSSTPSRCSSPPAARTPSAAPSRRRTGSSASGRPRTPRRPRS